MTLAHTVGFSSGIFQICKVPHTGQLRKKAACPDSPAYCIDDARQGFAFASFCCLLPDKYKDDKHCAGAL